LSKTQLDQHVAAVDSSLLEVLLVVEVSIVVAAGSVVDEVLLTAQLQPRAP
jgi:hypothetical protein